MSDNLTTRLYSREKVDVFVNTRKGTVAVYNRRKPSEEYCYRKIRGRGPVGYPCNIYSKKETKKTFDGAYNSYLEMHSLLSDTEKQEAYKRIYKNLNNGVLKALEDYDFVEIGIKGKYGDYIEAMVKPIERKKGETAKEYELREIKMRQNELRRAGINITYVLGNVVFNKNTNLFDSLKVRKEAKKYNEYAVIRTKNRIYGKENKTLRLKPAEHLESKQDDFLNEENAESIPNNEMGN